MLFFEDVVPTQRAESLDPLKYPSRVYCLDIAIFFLVLPA
jgi:hypothetical protein